MFSLNGKPIDIMSQKSSTANVGDLLTNKKLVTMCPNLHKLANICLWLPVSTTSVECNLSQMKLIKSRLSLLEIASHN